MMKSKVVKCAIAVVAVAAVVAAYLYVPRGGVILPFEKKTEQTLQMTETD